MERHVFLVLGRILSTFHPCQSQTTSSETFAIHNVHVVDVISGEVWMNRVVVILDGLIDTVIEAGLRTSLILLTGWTMVVPMSYRDCGICTHT